MQAIKKLIRPVGSALELAYRLSKHGKSKKTVQINNTQGIKETRGADMGGTQVHSVRLPGYVSEEDWILLWISD